MRIIFPTKIEFEIGRWYRAASIPGTKLIWTLLPKNTQEHLAIDMFVSDQKICDYYNKNYEARKCILDEDSTELGWIEL